VTLAHRIQLDPTVKQAQYFAKACGTARFTWNWALAEWNRQYALGLKPKASEIKKQFNAIKYERFPWLGEIHRDAHAQPFAQIGAAFRNFFAGRAEHPKFKKTGRCRDSFYVANDKFRITPNGMLLPQIGEVRALETLRFNGEVQSAVVSRDSDRWFISIAVEVENHPAGHPAGGLIGVDLGLTTFAALSTGEKIDSPRPLKKALCKLRRLGRWHSRKRLKSANRRKATIKLARQHRRIKNIRHDFIHKFTTRLAKNHSEICIEDLNVSGMVKNHNLAFHISDAAWGESRRQLEYKTVLYGSTLTVRDRFYASTHLCSCCGAKAPKMALSVRTWMCDKCGSIHDRDYNASSNLIKPTTAGYAGSYASGETGAVRPLGERGTLPCAHFGAQER